MRRVEKVEEGKGECCCCCCGPPLKGPNNGPPLSLGAFERGEGRMRRGGEEIRGGGGSSCAKPNELSAAGPDCRPPAAADPLPSLRWRISRLRPSSSPLIIGQEWGREGGNVPLLAPSSSLVSLVVAAMLLDTILCGPPPPPLQANLAHSRWMWLAAAYNGGREGAKEKV